MAPKCAFSCVSGDKGSWALLLHFKRQFGPTFQKEREKKEKQDKDWHIWCGKVFLDMNARKDKIPFAIKGKAYQQVAPMC